ncbi:hypothetical protein [Streptomyces sp. CBMA29]|uniref:hypothetical protein n=1 Tax=Streptomyces sp. CBMA29 TaxID=1896314 RepID=UPI001662076A|nr:hypothetical protein [Streptomyces sp. CBMA29]MBD0736459.1 hypothetical protein [Streptomyces sp. CBMA29]
MYFLRGDGRGTLIGGGWNAMTAVNRHGDLIGDADGDNVNDLYATFDDAPAFYQDLGSGGAGQAEAG